MSMQDDAGSPEAHPLFPQSEDDEDENIKLVSFITISRIENGKQYLAPRQRRADELRSLDQLHAEFGGGEYVLTAFHNGRISTRRKLNLPGKSKPMYDDGISSAEESRATAQAPQIAPADPMQALMGSQGGGSLMGLIMMMMQQMMQQQAAAAQSQTQMFLAMMQGNQQSSSEEKASARAELQANIERERISSERTMALMREMMSTRGGGGSGEEFTRGVEFMRSFATQQVETLRAAAKGDNETDWGSILESLGQVLQGAGMLKDLAGGGNSVGLPEGVTPQVEVTPS